ncbi:MAG: hypothetical protein ACYCUI_13645 [Vulcanimicrobiaceae bacterium]
MNTAHLQRLADAATRRAADRRLPLFVRRHWSHMATGWLRRWEIAARLIPLTTHIRVQGDAYAALESWNAEVKAQLSRCSFADAFRNRINFQSPQP